MADIKCTFSGSSQRASYTFPLMLILLEPCDCLCEFWFTGDLLLHPKLQKTGTSCVVQYGVLLITQSPPPKVITHFIVFALINSTVLNSAKSGALFSRGLCKTAALREGQKKDEVSSCQKLQRNLRS